MLAGLKQDFIKGNNPRKDADVIVILRDPFERWFSGTVEWFAIAQDPFEYQPVEKMLPALDRWIKFPFRAFDYHTEPQSATLIQELPEFFGNVFYFYQDKQVLNSINEKFDIFETIEHKNKITDRHRPPFKKALNKWIKRNKNSLMPKLQEFYKDDYDLIKQSCFVNRPIAGSIL